MSRFVREKLAHTAAAGSIGLFSITGCVDGRMPAQWRSSETPVPHQSGQEGQWTPQYDPASPVPVGTVERPPVVTPAPTVQPRPFPTSMVPIPAQPAAAVTCNDSTVAPMTWRTATALRSDAFAREKCGTSPDKKEGMCTVGADQTVYITSSPRKSLLLPAVSLPFESHKATGLPERSTVVFKCAEGQWRLGTIDDVKHEVGTKSPAAKNFIGCVPVGAPDNAPFIQGALQVGMNLVAP